MNHQASINLVIVNNKLRVVTLERPDGSISFTDRETLSKVFELCGYLAERAEMRDNAIPDREMVREAANGATFEEFVWE